MHVFYWKGEIKVTFESSVFLASRLLSSLLWRVGKVWPHATVIFINYVCLGMFWIFKIVLGVVELRTATSLLAKSLHIWGPASVTSSEQGLKHIMHNCDIKFHSIKCCRKEQKSRLHLKLITLGSVSVWQLKTQAHKGEYKDFKMWHFKYQLLNIYATD